MSRVVMGQPNGRNSDITIATIEPMPEEHVSFFGIWMVLVEFLRDHMGISFWSIQPCPFG
jgi:hypothetical protein